MRLGTKRPWKSIHEILLQHAGRGPRSTAYSYSPDTALEPKVLTYEDLLLQAQRVAARLVDERFSGQRILLLFPPSLSFVPTFLGCLFAGVIPVPVNPPKLNDRSMRLYSIIKDCSARGLITDSTLKEKVGQAMANLPPEASIPIFAAEDFLSSSSPREEILFSSCSREADIAFLQYTSGSTGDPKGVMVTHGNLIANEEMIAEAFGHTPETIIAGWLPMFHDMGLIGTVLHPLFLGLPAHLMSPVAFIQKPSRWLELISHVKATSSGGPNFAYDLCTESISAEQKQTLELNSWSVAFNGAEPVRHETMRKFAAAFRDCGFDRRAFYPTYGMAEATLLISGGRAREGYNFEIIDKQELEKNQAKVIARSNNTVGELDKADEVQGNSNVVTAVSCGTTWLEQEIAVVHPETFIACKDGEVGEIWVSGPHVASGYWQRPDLSREVFSAKISTSADENLTVGDEKTFLRTGDLGYLRGAELFITGRWKDLIVIRGRNHYPQDIERTVEAANSALRTGHTAAFATVSDKDSGERLVVFCTIQRELLRRVDTTSLAREIQDKITAVHDLSVAAIVFLKPGQIPMTSSGKIQRRLCRKLFQDKAIEPHFLWSADGPYVASPKPASDSTRTPDIEDLTDNQLKIYSSLVKNFREVSRNPKLAVKLDVRPTQLGIDSLSSVRLAALLSEEFKMNLSPNLVFEHETVHSLMLHVDKVGASKSEEISRDEDIGQTPLSVSQKRIWFLSQQEKSAAYNLPLCLDLRGDLDLSALFHSFEGLVQRQKTLRSSFPNINGEPRQVLRETSEFGWEVIDLSSHSDEEKSQELGRLREMETYHVFDLSAEPLLRVKVLKFSSTRHYLLVNIHHIVFDGPSASVMAREISEIYNSQLEKRDSRLPRLLTSFASYASHQNQTLDSESTKRQIEFWRKHLEIAPAPLELPLDKPRPLKSSGRGSSVSFQIPTSLVERVKRLAQIKSITPFMIYLATYATLLARMGRTEDLVIGVPIANRRDPKLENLIGLFVNTLPFRIDLSNSPTFESLIERIKAFSLAAYANQDVPLDRLVEVLKPNRQVHGSSFFQVLMIHQNANFADQFHFNGLESRVLPDQHSPAQFDLRLFITESDQSAEACFTYNDDLFDKGSVTRWTSHFLNLLSTLSASPHQTVHAVDLLTEEEKEFYQSKIHGPGVGSVAETTLTELFEEQAAKFSGRPAIRFGSDEISYGELDRRSNQIAHYLQGLGVGIEDKVGVVLDGTPDLVITVLGILKAGAAYVPVDILSPRERLMTILSEADVKAVLTSKDLLPKFQTSKDENHWLSLDQIVQKAETLPTHKIFLPQDSRRLAYILFTSGSTGKPKGVQIEHRSLVNLFQSMIEQQSVSDRDRILAMTSPSFDISTFELFVPLLVGGCVFPVRRTDALNGIELVSIIERQKINFINSTPANYRMLMEAGWSGGSTFKLIICGEALSRQLASALLQRCGRLWNLYGPTECTVFATGLEVRADQRSQSPDGMEPIDFPLANISAYIFDSNFLPVPFGVPGELCLGGHCVARGYYKNPQLNDQKFITNPRPELAPAFENGKLYRTGDLVRYRDGHIEYLGRIDNQVKIRGFRIELGEIESAIGDWPELAKTKDFFQCVVMVSDKITGETALYAFLQLPPDFSFAARELKSFLKERLPSYMIPTHFEVVTDIPKNSSGKTDRQKLFAKLVNQRSLDSTEGDRRDVPERVEGFDERSTTGRLISIWSSLLNFQTSNLESSSDFFDLGGHSLLILKLQLRIQKEFNVTLSVRDIFERPTLGDLSGLIDDQQKVKTAPVVMTTDLQIDRTTSQLPSFGQERMWILQTLNPESSSYNMTQAFFIRGILDTEALNRALQKLVETYEVFRTYFLLESGQLKQRVAPLSSINYAFLVQKELPLDLEAALREETLRPFDLAEGPLLRATLWQQGPEQYTFLLSIHHIVADGWSLPIIFDAIRRNYASERRPKQVQNAPEEQVQDARSEQYRNAPEEQYLEYALAQRASVGTDGWNRQLAYWAESLRGANSVLNLPMDVLEQNGHLAGSAAKFEFALPPVFKRKVEEVARSRGMTPFMVLLASYSAFLHVCSGDDDFVVGVPVAGRTTPETQKSVGFFVNTLPLRQSFSRPFDASQITVDEHLKRVKEGVLGGLANQEFPVDKIVEALAPERVGARSPLFQTLFLFENQAPVPFELTDLQVERIETNSSQPKLDLSLTVTLADGAYRGTFEFDNKLFSVATIERWASSFELILSQILDHPELLIQELDQGEIPRIHPASEAQRRLFARESLASVHPSLMIEMSGRLDSQALIDSLRIVQKWNPQLRTSFFSSPGKLFQAVHPRCELPLVKLPRKANLDEGRSNTEEFLLDGFETTNQPMLWRVVLQPVGGKTGPCLTHLLGITLHSLIADEISLQILLGQIAKVYSQKLNGSFSMHPANFFKRPDVVNREANGTTAEEFWRSALLGLPPVLDLPGKGLRPALQTLGNEKIALRLNEDINGHLENLFLRGADHFFSFGLASFAAFLYRITGQDDFAVGVSNPSAFFGQNILSQQAVQRLPMRFQFSKHSFQTKEWSHFVESTLGQVSNILNHCQVKFDSIVEWSSAERNLTFSPLCQTSFEFTSIATFGNFENLELKQREFKESAGLDDLKLNIIQQADGEFEVQFLYNGNLFSQNLMTNALQKYVQFLQGIFSQSEVHWSKLPIHSEVELARLLEVSRNDGFSKQISLTLPELFDEQARLRPQKAAIFFESQTWTYQQIQEMVDVLSKQLRKIGVGPGIPVAVHFERSPTLLVSLLAILKSGGYYLPLDPNYPLERVQYMLDDSGAAILLTEPSKASAWSSVESLRIVGVDCTDLPLSAKNGDPEVLRERLNDNFAQLQQTAYVMYTSGSTGRPKGVLIEHQSLTNFLLAMQQKPGFCETDHLDALTTVSFDIAGLEMFLPLICGGSLEILPQSLSSDGNLLAKHLETTQATVVQATPATWRMLLKAKWNGNKNLKVLCGGEAMSGDLARSLLNKTGEVWNMYGPTETTVWSLIHHVTPADVKSASVPIGQPIDQTTVYILDKDLQLVGFGGKGQLFIGGIGLAKGYHERQALSDEKFMTVQLPDRVERLYATGDEIRLDEDGRRFFVGRLDGQIKLRGHRIELGEIETRANQFTAGVNSVATIKKDAVRGDQLLLYVVTNPALSKDDQPAWSRKLRGYLVEMLPAFMIPSHIIFLTEFPLTPAKKVDRQKLPFVPNSPDATESILIATQEQRVMHGLWVDVLGHNQIGLQDSFFQVGGHSLLLAVLTEKINLRFQRRLTVAQLFQNPTISQMVNLLEQVEA